MARGSVSLFLGSVRLFQPEARILYQAWQGGSRSLFQRLYSDQTELVIDAMFGAGLSRSIEGKARDSLMPLIARKIPVCAIDALAAFVDWYKRAPGIGCGSSGINRLTFFS